MDKMENFVMPKLGADPEMFFFRDGRVIGSEKVMPQSGILYMHGVTEANMDPNGENKVIMDGVQAEFNPVAAQCRQILSRNIASCFQILHDRINKIGGGVVADFSQLVEVSQEEMDSLSDNSKRFGCMPSYNVYEESGIHVNPKEYRYRSAGGHIHLGGTTDGVTKVLKDTEHLVPLLDAIVGNTCVLIDRDPGNAERRKVYGRAGEHRLPRYGIEYRTPSNFWLRSYPVMSLVFGLARHAVNVLYNGKKFHDEILSTVDIDDVRKAINENDFALAKRNFNKIMPVLMEMDASTNNYANGYHPINKHNIKAFKHFVKMGIDYWFPKDEIMNHWLDTKNIGTSGKGWESFVEDVVVKDMNKK